MRQGKLLGYVLAGGESSRMRGHGLPLDKASLVWDGQTLLDRAVSLLQSVCERTAILCGSDERCARLQLGRRGIIDRFGRMGPLGGLEAALADAEEHGASWVLIVPVDLPCLTPNLLHALVGAAVAQQTSACCFQEAGWAQPLPAVVRVDTLPLIQAALLAGERKFMVVLSSIAQRLTPTVGLLTIEAPDASSSDHGGRWFWNVNTPEEFYLLQRGETPKSLVHRSTHGE